MAILAKPFGEILFFIYKHLAFENYGVAIILFTLLIKVVLLPLTIKQMKSTAKMQEIQPQLQEIQKRYKNDKEKLQQETLKVYQENNVNPMGGCLSLFIQMPILISLFYVITQPLTYMLGKSKDVITELAGYVGAQLGKANVHSQIEILNYFSRHVDELGQFADKLSPSELINFNFLGLNLGLTPTINTGKLFGPEMAVYLPLLLIPILGVVATYFSSKMMMPQNKGGKENNPATPNSMLYVGPLLTLIFSFQLPAGVGLYWIAGYVFQILQQLYINKVVMKKEAT